MNTYESEKLDFLGGARNKDILSPTIASLADISIMITKNEEVNIIANRFGKCTLNGVLKSILNNDNCKILVIDENDCNTEVYDLTKRYEKADRERIIHSRVAMLNQTIRKAYDKLNKLQHELEKIN